MSRSTSRLRPLLAIPLIAAPFLILVLLVTLWTPLLPPVLPRQFDSSGVATTIPTDLMVLSTLMVSLSGLTWAVIAAIRRDALHTRETSLLGPSLATSLPLGAWITLAGATVNAPDPENPQLNFWWAAIAITLIYGFLPPLAGQHKVALRS